MKREFKNDGKCLAPGCEIHAFCKGLCRMHYARKIKLGTLDLPPKLSIIDKLMEGRKIDENGCWIWTKSIGSSGYGQIYDSMRIPIGVHRVSYAHFVGPIPDSMYICHKCDVKNCFNPDHLFIGTAKENMNDASKKCRIVCGEENKLSKLDSVSIKQIRSEWISGGITQKTLSERFNCSQANISFIVTGKTWAHVPIEKRESLAV